MASVDDAADQRSDHEAGISVEKSVDSGVKIDAARGQLVPLGHVDVWVNDSGGDGDVVLLLSAADSAFFRYTQAVVRPLVDAELRMVRFDQRDSGRSSHVPSSQVYDLDDLTADAIGVLDHLGIGRAHVMGRSMGGMVAQLMALDHPSRVASLTLVSTSPGVGDDRLPPADDGLIDDLAMMMFEGPAKDANARVDWIVEHQRLFSGSRFAFDVPQQTSLAEADLANGWRAETGHGAAVHGSPSRVERVTNIDIPVLVVHGTADKVFPIEHAHVLAGAIPTAALVTIEGFGHEPLDPVMDELWPALAAHLEGAGARIKSDPN